MILSSVARFSSSWGYYFTKLSGIDVHYETKSVKNGNAVEQINDKRPLWYFVCVSVPINVRRKGKLTKSFVLKLAQKLELECYYLKDSKEDSVALIKIQAIILTH